MSKQTSFPLDETNLGWIKGWAVLRQEPWDLAGIFPTREAATVELTKQGPPYQLAYGSRRLGSNDFIEE